jgi:hypothetical protein
MVKREYLALVISVLLTTRAWGYRPYDATDADVADDDEVEVELGWQRADSNEGDLNSMNAVLNFGLGGDREVVAEGKWRKFRPPVGEPDSSFGDLGVFLKQIHRRGSLQGESGLSFASECGALIPTQHEHAGVGAECLLITSHELSSVAIHINAGLAYEANHRWARSFGLIVEGTSDQRFKPGLELSQERRDGERSEIAVMIGVTWAIATTCAIDIAHRQQLQPSTDPREWRMGLTWTH